MNKVFCFNCGAKYEFTIAPPNFCSKCGTSLNSLASSNTKKPRKAAMSNDSEGDEDLDEDGGATFSNIDSVPHIESLQVTIEPFPGYERLSLTRGDDGILKIDAANDFKIRKQEMPTK